MPNYFNLSLENEDDEVDKLKFKPFQMINKTNYSNISNFLLSEAKYTPLRHLHHTKAAQFYDFHSNFSYSE